MSKKHAYLIMAHNNFYCLEKLLLLLDDSRNDIYLHIDKKVKDFDFVYFQRLCVNANVIYPKRRINVTWGTQSQVKTEMLLFETASKNGPYHYYHLLSGSDLPLKSQNYIHSFLHHDNTCYIYCKETPSLLDYQRVSRYHLFICPKNTFLIRISHYLNILQDMFSVDRFAKYRMELKKGGNWCSLPHTAILYLLSKKKTVMRLTLWSICADEVYKQTLLYASENKVIPQDLREIRRLGKPHPYTYTTQDYEYLSCSNALFARKFDDTHDRNIIDLLYNHINNQEEAMT